VCEATFTASSQQTGALYHHKSKTCIF